MFKVCRKVIVSLLKLLFLIHGCKSSTEQFEIASEDALVEMANIILQNYFMTRSYTIGISHNVMDKINENFQNNVLDKILKTLESNVAIRFEKVKNWKKPVNNQHNLVFVDSVEGFK